MAGVSAVRVFADAAELMRAAADEVVRCAAEAVRERSRFAWALSGGSTPRDLYRRLASPPHRDRMPWSAVHVFWGDERHVPPDHPDSNFRMAREALLDAVPLPAANVHRIRGEEPDAAVAAALYEAELRAFFPHAPVFDLVLLGLGRDAHTASLFPGSAALRERERLVIAVTAVTAVTATGVESQPTFRITLTPPVLDQARLCTFLVSGEDKAEALRAVLEGPHDPERYPAQIIEGGCLRCLWMVDRAAARLLKTAA